MVKHFQSSKCIGFGLVIHWSTESRTGRLSKKPESPGNMIKIYSNDILSRGNKWLIYWKRILPKILPLPLDHLIVYVYIEFNGTILSIHLDNLHKIRVNESTEDDQSPMIFVKAVNLKKYKVSSVPVVRETSSPRQELVKHHYTSSSTSSIPVLVHLKYLNSA